MTEGGRRPWWHDICLFRGRTKSVNIGSSRVGTWPPLLEPEKLEMLGPPPWRSPTLAAGETSPLTDRQVPPLHPGRPAGVFFAAGKDLRRPACLMVGYVHNKPALISCPDSTVAIQNHAGESVVKRTIALVVGLLFLAGCGSDEKPGRIVTDPRGFRYVVWPFTFNGLTVGRPIERLDQIAALGYRNPAEVRSRVEAYLKRKNLTEADLAVHQIVALGLKFRGRMLSELGPEKYLGQLLAFFKIKKADFKRLRASFYFGGGTLYTVIIRDRKLPAPIAPDAGVDKFIAALGKPDLLLEVKLEKGNRFKMTRVKWYVWRNMTCWVHQGLVVRVIIGSGHSYWVGPRPQDNNHFSCGWIMPWPMIQRLAKRPDFYAKLRQVAEAQGVAWRPENSFLIEAVYDKLAHFSDGFPLDSWGLKATFPGLEGLRSHEACYRGLAPLLPHLFPGLKIDPKKFRIESCSTSFRAPAIISLVNIRFTPPGSLTRAEFERIFGSPDKVHTVQDRGQPSLGLFYLKKNIVAYFRGGRFQGVEFVAAPIVYPPPTRAEER
jgi:hypothetical protein